MFIVIKRKPETRFLPCKHPLVGTTARIGRLRPLFKELGYLCRQIRTQGICCVSVKFRTMKTEDIENVELSYLTLDDYQELKTAMVLSYRNMPDAYWEEYQIKALIKKFREGQVVIKINGLIAGCALSIIVEYEKFSDNHTYKQITGNYTFNTHSAKGNVLYGIDVFIKPEFRGLRLARRLYDYRKELCEKLNLERIVFGGRIPNFHKYASEHSAKEYIEKVKRKELHDQIGRASWRERL